MELKIYTEAALTRNLPQHRLRRGDIVKLVDHHTAPDGTPGYTVEVLDVLGDTLLVLTLEAAALQPLHHHEILNARIRACPPNSPSPP